MQGLFTFLNSLRGNLLTGLPGSERSLSMTERADSTPVYAALDPDTILGAIDSVGSHSNGRLLALNSYENRVYQVGVDDDRFLIAKFYRPGRWSDSAILEEHHFSGELIEHQIPVVAPLPGPDDRTLHEFHGYRFSLYPRQGGRWPDLDKSDHLEWMGRLLGRLHWVGALRAFQHRPSLNIETFGVASYQFLLEQGFLPPHVELAYRSLVEDLLRQIRTAWERAGKVHAIRLHGDCHPGNILWTDDGPHFVDLDDCRMGPAVQDLWMLLSGERHEMEQQLSRILAGYTRFADFRPGELYLIEALRTLRMIHYAAWLARRWDDPAFPQAFPWFGSTRYWEDHILSLREQAALLDEPLLSI